MRISPPEGGTTEFFMIGFYDYTVILTYLSILSAGTGIVVSLSGLGHPYIGCLFLLVCGLCDAFDGKVARTKQNRTEMEMNFGIQIDSLADVVSFGVLPACIGAAMLRRSQLLTNFFDANPKSWYVLLAKGVFFGILILYILAAMIRLAYFNVDEEIRSRTEGGVRKYYTGLPVTSAALIFPTVLMLDYVISYFAKTRLDFTPLYFAVAVLVGLLFLSKIRIKKPGLRGILILVGIGTVEFALMAVLYVIIGYRLV